MNSSGNLAGKVAVVTGGASGIGAAIARLFARHGAQVVVADLPQQGARAEAVCKEIGDGAVFAQCDVTNEEQLAAAVDLATSKFGRLDVMVNNAGILGALGPIDQLKAEDIDCTLAVHVRGTILGCKHAARVMKPQRSGVILNMASVAGLNGGFGPHVYTAAKHAIVGLTKNLAHELHHHGIRSNAIAPAGTDTPMIGSFLIGDPDASVHEMLAKSTPTKALAAEDMAQAALFLASDLSAGVNGHILAVDGGMTANASANPPNPMVSVYNPPMMEGGRQGLDRSDRFPGVASLVPPQ